MADQIEAAKTTETPAVPTVDRAAVDALVARAAKPKGAPPVPKASTTPLPASPEKSPASALPSGGTSSAQPDDSSSKQDAKTGEAAGEGDSKLAKRLASIAAEEGKLRQREEALKTREASQNDAVAKWTTLQEAKTKGDRMAALKVLFEDGELTGDVYNDLTAHVLAKGGKGGEGKEALSKEDVAAIVAEGIEGAKKKDADARQAQGQEVRDGYTKAVVSTFDKGRDRWPLIDKLGIAINPKPEDLPEIARRGLRVVDIHTRLEDHWQKTGKATGKTLSPEEVLDLVEQELAASIEASGYARTKVEAPEGGNGPAGASAPSGKTTTVTGSWTRDQAGTSPPSEKAEGPKSLKDSIAETKRKHRLT